MKKLILIPVVALLFTACRENSIASEKTLAENTVAENTLAENTIAYTALVRAGEKAGLKPTEVIVVKERVRESSKPRVQERVVYQNNSTHSAKVAQKRGMSARAKYAIVGGVGGAVVGGVATKSTKGAVIGGVLGAGTGYILGRKRDKKTGRIQ